MATLFSLLSLVPLLPVYAFPQGPPGVQITNGEIEPTGTATACSTITTTIGTLVNIIPVPCATDGTALPPTFTELVDVGGTTASLVIGPTDVEFISEPWLDQPSSSQSASSTSGAASSGVSSTSDIASLSASISSAAGSSSAASVTSAPGLSNSSTSGAASATSAPRPVSSTSVQNANSGSVVGSSSSLIPVGNSSTSAVPSAESGIPSSSGSSATLASITPGSSGSSASGLQSTGSSSVAGSSSGVVSAGNSSTAAVPSGGTGIPSVSGSSETVTPSVGLNSSSASVPAGPASQSVSLGSSSITQTASPGSTTSALPPTTSGASITAAPSSTSNTAPFVPITSPATTIAAVGPVASSSAKAVQTSIAIIIPLIQSYIKDPSCPSCGPDAINALKGVLPEIEALSNEIGPGPSSQPCSASINLLQDIFNAVKCAAQYVDNTITHIQGGEDEIDTVTSDLTSLTDIQEPLDNDSENDENSSQQSQESQSSQESSSQTSSSQSSSSQTSSQSSSSASSSGSCLLPPEITLPPDSLTGIAQPDQPTSVVVTGLPSFDGSTVGSASGSSTASSSGSASPSGSSGLPSITSSTPASSSPTASASGSSVTPSVQSSTSSGSAPSSTPASSAPASSTPASITAAPPKSTIAANFCMTDGAPWYSPISWCDCGASATYPLRSVSGASTGDCSYTTLPDSTIKPVSTSAAPTNIPGQGGLPGCNYVLYPDGQGCPYANYCDCGGTYVGLLTTSVSGTVSTNCAYTLQPTANDCPAPTTTPATSTPPPPSTTPPAQPTPTPNVAIIIYREDSCGDIDAGCTSDGRVYDITPGEPVPVCGTAKTATTFDYTEDVQNETEDYSISTPKFTSHDTFKNCQYQGTADVVGTFSCDGFPTPVSCITPAAQATSCSNSHSLDEDDFTPIVYCEWVQS